jgi:multimeric flavodoxin WrbA
LPIPTTISPSNGNETAIGCSSSTARRKSGEAKSRVLVICGSPRNDGSCPGEMSKTFRLAQIAQHTLEGEGIEVDLLDLSLLTNEFQRNIHPCKGCVSTAMPLCHWPCSCYPNYALGQTNDWMAEIYERWTAAHGILIVTPVHWYQATSALKLMIDRLVCADGGNPDPTSTGGKDAEKAKALELKGWSYPKHLEGTRVRRRRARRRIGNRVGASRAVRLARLDGTRRVGFPRAP